MSGDVINFPAARLVRREVGARNEGGIDLGPSADLAIWMHDVIVNGLRSGHFAHHQQGPCAALADLLLQVVGSTYIGVAEGHFERIYRCSPYAFLVSLIES